MADANKEWRQCWLDDFPDSQMPDDELSKRE